MKIESIKIENFRGYKEEVKIKFDDLTVFVGKNDVGKSSVLEALDIFFNEGKGAVKLEKDDINVINEKDENFEIKISVCFNDLPERIIIDSTFETTLMQEYLLNEEGNLEIIKKYKNGGAAKVFVKANHPNNEKCSNLLLAKNAELKKIVQQESIVCDKQSVNAELRKSIWNNYKDDLQLNEKEIDVSKEDAKKIWDKLVYYMPVYSLFQSDRKNSDGDDEVQNPLKEAIKQILSEKRLQEKLEEIANEVHEKLKEVSEITLEKLREMDENIADSLKAVIPSSENLKWQDVFKGVSISSDNDISINKRGSGVKRLVLLNFFRAEAERRAKLEGETVIIYAIEEPETSQHSNNQLILIEAFKRLASYVNTQIILTTHSPKIVKQLEFKNLRMIKNSVNNIKEILDVNPGQLNYPSLNEVNYIAFGEISEEYHDEIYSYIEFQNWRKEYSIGKSTREYNKVYHDKIKKENIILTDYIRHQIHHPENKENIRYTQEELCQSITMMRDFIESKKASGVINEP